MNETFLTVADRGEATFAVRGSQFVGRVAPVDSVDMAEAFVKETRQDHPDATHHVPAYRVRTDPLREYASDDGEPGGSAGKPTLTVLEREELENVVAVVTRYYGGTNLGVGGLARAYGRAVKLGIEAAGITEQQPHEQAVVCVEYDDSGTVRGILESADIGYDADYAEHVTFRVRVPLHRAEALFDRLRSATGGRVDIDTVAESSTDDRASEVDSTDNEQSDER